MCHEGRNPNIKLVQKSTFHDEQHPSDGCISYSVRASLNNGPCRQFPIVDSDRSHVPGFDPKQVQVESMAEMRG